MKNLVSSWLLLLTFLPAAAVANVNLGGDAVPALPSFATINDFYAMQATKNTGEVSRLCPSTKGEYAANLDLFQEKIDMALANPGRCFGSIPGFGFGGGSRCVVRAALYASILEEQKNPVALCYELHTLKEAYDVALASSLIENEEQKKLVLDTLGTLETCLKDSKKRSEIEGCYTAFKFSLSQILNI
jgi:hypothetical protein